MSLRQLDEKAAPDEPNPTDVAVRMVRRLRWLTLLFGGSILLAAPGWHLYDIDAFAALLAALGALLLCISLWTTRIKSENPGFMLPLLFAVLDLVLTFPILVYSVLCISGGDSHSAVTAIDLTIAFIAMMGGAYLAILQFGQAYAYGKRFDANGPRGFELVMREPMHRSDSTSRPE